LNPRPLGYEHYDVCLSRLGPSLAGAVTSADGTDPVSLRRLRLPRLGLSRHVRFTNRFTEQAIHLRFPAPFPILAAAVLGPPPSRPGSRSNRVGTCRASIRRAAEMLP